MKLKFIVITFLLVLTSCGTDTTSSNIVPKEEVAVSTSPAISISECAPIFGGTFISPTTFQSDNKAYQLLGVKTFSENRNDVPTDFLKNLEQNAFCLKHDPSIKDQSIVYIFSKSDTLLNASVIQAGYGKTDSAGDYVYKNYFAGLEKEAQGAKRGLWAKYPNGVITTPSPDTTVSAPAAATIKDIKVNEATEHVYEYVRFEMDVASVGKSDKVVYLNSLADYTDLKNVALTINLPAADSRLAQIATRGDELKKKRAVVQGKLTLVKGKLQVILENGSQILFTK